ncbi:hypothetical protein IAU59_003849 [Kwoniella sp. CBS 9459]
MSLFPSAFDTGSTPGPSKGFSKSIPKPSPRGNSNFKPGSIASSSHNNKSNKRKRPSVGAGDVSAGRASNQDDLIKSTQANLEKLMNKIERGDFKEKGADGRESMGSGQGGSTSIGGSKKAKKNGGAASSASHNDRDGPLSNTPKSKAKKDNNKGKGNQSTALPSPAQIKAGGTPNGKGDKQSKGNEGKALTPTSTKTNMKAKTHADAAQASFEPFEIPLSSLPSGKGKVSVGGDAAGMTDMQRNMQAKLEGARFRWINEQLYSTPSTDAVAMMKKDPKIFADYHQTHRLLTAGWPSPPLPHIIKTLSPLPAGAVIADLGCGDAGLARALVPQGKVVLSYDLVGDSGWVVEADFLEKVPLPGRPGGLTHIGGSEDGSKKSKKGKGGGGGGGAKGRNASADASEIVDVVVCCLSLMGVNWVGGIAEACRILKQGGTLQVAEVTSRFISTEAFVQKVESFGFTLDEQDSPSTHFTLFKFTKHSEVPLGPARGEKGWKERVEEGEGILRGCVYKKR